MEKTTYNDGRHYFVAGKIRKPTKEEEKIYYNLYTTMLTELKNSKTIGGFNYKKYIEVTANNEGHKRVLIGVRCQDGVAYIRSLQYDR